MSTLDVRSRFAHGFPLDVTFAADSGVTVLFGASGAGKTTILDAIAGLRHPDAGRVVLDGTKLFDSERNVNLKPERRCIGYVPQSLALFPHMTAAENVAFGIRGGNAQQQANEWLVRVGLRDKERMRPAHLSGGERQRVAVARALATRPKLLLLDEPFSALDSELKLRLVADLKTWIEPNVPVLFVTHDLVEALAAADRVIEIAAGRIVSTGTADEVLAARRERLLSSLDFPLRPLRP
ncbi:MAG TPA: ATP-binding cassette domain-containing protein [Terriglobales bacterium]|jgi:molybdate transport system ATP-binding protein